MSCHSRHVNNVSLWFIVFSLTRTRHCLLLTSKFMVTRGKKLIITRLYNTTVWFLRSIFTGNDHNAMISSHFHHRFTPALPLVPGLCLRQHLEWVGSGVVHVFTGSGTMRNWQDQQVVYSCTRHCTHCTVGIPALVSGKMVCISALRTKVSSHSEWTLRNSLDRWKGKFKNGQRQESVTSQINI